MSQYFSFQWHITDECDQRCKHCYIFSGEGCKELKSMTWKQMTEVVANCEDFCKGYKKVTRVTFLCLCNKIVRTFAG